MISLFNAKHYKQVTFIFLAALFIVVIILLPEYRTAIHIIGFLGILLSAEVAFNFFCKLPMKLGASGIIEYRPDVPAYTFVRAVILVIGATIGVCGISVFIIY